MTASVILAFFTGFIICIALAMIDSFLIFLPSSIVSVLSYLSASAHFTSISRGILDTRDVIYFVSLTALFIAATVRLQQNAKN